MSAYLVLSQARVLLLCLSTANPALLTFYLAGRLIYPLNRLNTLILSRLVHSRTLGQLLKPTKYRLLGPVR